MKTRLTLLAILGSSLASADIIYSFTGGGAFFGTNATYGFRFTPVVDITVNSLGLFDRDANGLSGSHRVGIWGLSQHLGRRAGDHSRWTSRPLSLHASDGDAAL